MRITPPRLKPYTERFSTDMAIEQVREYFRNLGLAERIIEPEQPTPTVELAAGALGTEPSRIAKSLAFSLKSGVIIIVAAGDVRIDKAAFKSVLGEKARMLSAEETLEKTGYAVGGVCPFALKGGIRVYTDSSLKRFDTVYPSAGNDHSGIRLSPDELYVLSGASGWVSVTREK